MLAYADAWKIFIAQFLSVRCDGLFPDIDLVAAVETSDGRLHVEMDGAGRTPGDHLNAGIVVNPEVIDFLLDAAGRGTDDKDVVSEVQGLVLNFDFPD